MVMKKNELNLIRILVFREYWEYEKWKVFSIIFEGNL